MTTGTLQAGGAKEVPSEAAPAKAVPPEKAEAGVMDTSRMCFPVFPMLSRGLVSHVARLDWSPSCLKVRLVELISQTQDRRSGKLHAYCPRHTGVSAQNSSSFEPCISVRFCFAVSVSKDGLNGRESAIRIVASSFHFGLRPAVVNTIFRYK